MRTLLIIPAYNEEKSIGNLLAKLDDKYSQYDYIVINDCSKDNTSGVVRKYNGKLINLPINLGLSGGIKTGMIYAVQNSYDICVQIDGDGQHKPEYIELLVKEIESGNDISIGSRFVGNNNNYKQTLLRTAGAKWLSFIAKLQSGLYLTDPTSGMRAYNRRTFEKMIHDINARPEPDTIIMFARNGYKVKEVPVVMDERQAGASHLGGAMSAIKYMTHTTIAILLNARRKVSK